MEWADKRNIRLEYIQPGKPQQNAYIERYTRTVRGEWLGQSIFEIIQEVQDQATEWLWTYDKMTQQGHRRHHTHNEIENSHLSSTAGHH